MARFFRLCHRNLTITSGVGAVLDGRTVDGTASNRLFDISGSSSVTLDGLHLQHGDAPSEKVEDCHKWRGCSFESFARGGCVKVEDSDLTVSNAHFTQCKAESVDVGQGGAVHIGCGEGARCQITVDSSNFNSNVARGVSDEGAGGAIFATYDADLDRFDLTVRNSLFAHNEAGEEDDSRTASENKKGSGGAICLDGDRNLHESSGGPGVAAVTVTVDASVFDRNRASEGGALGEFSCTLHDAVVSVDTFDISNGRSINGYCCHILVRALSAFISALIHHSFCTRSDD